MWAVASQPLAKFKEAVVRQWLKEERSKILP